MKLQRISHNSQFEGNMTMNAVITLSEWVGARGNCIRFEVEGLPSGPF